MLRDIIDRNLVTVRPDAKVTEAAERMAEENVGCVLVLADDGKPRGILTDRDIVVRCLAKNVDVNDCTVENVLTESLETVNEHDGFFDCIKKMNEAEERRIPVVDNSGKAIAIISFGDILAVLGKELHALTAVTRPGEERKVAA
jgi:CBS domain-containing protein